jgi:tRNA threonylcarbamoyladenosine biosynthesis protein TsaE
MQVHLHWANEAQMATYANGLANRNGIGQAFIALDGDLGAGKTSLVRILLQALGVKGRIKSPTYTIMEHYVLSGSPHLTASHFDFYRFNDPQEWEDAGFRDVFASPGLKLVEWPDKAHGVLPLPDLGISISTLGDETRQVVLRAFTLLGQALISPVDASEPLTPTVIKAQIPFQSTPQPPRND